MLLFFFRFSLEVSACADNSLLTLHSFLATYANAGQSQITFDVGSAIDSIGHVMQTSDVSEDTSTERVEENAPDEDGSKGP